MKNKILICDDDKGITDMLEMLLGTENFDLLVENDSVKVFSKIREFSPQLLIVDLWMPVISGDQLMRRIRKHPETKGIYILCISASRDGEDVAMDAGANLFLAKPFDMEEFLAAVDDGITKFGHELVDKEIRD